MKSRVEFYQAGLKPSRERPTFAWLTRGGMLILLLWGGAFAVAAFANHRLQEQNRQLEAAVEAGAAGLAQLQQSLALLSRSQDDSQRQRLEQDIRARQRLLGVLNKESFVSYATTLKDLAQIPWQNVALQGLTLNGRHMVLRGEASRGAAVPAWIMGFEQSDSLRDHAFGRLDIRQQGEGIWSFTLHSEGATP
ncbi:PilN domain-containing protein [Zobellella iuensis]|uniref:Fimbrial assembly protein n=1 Tax=Zobellella iuensis TaxID=2803811 RepID=A0ABS1QQQ3_9GAMM|nr:fimbrial assembly protein [Zobellella iuensis]MBL1377198.1 fimbrial assembly protein [Zobellella iuensis]